MDQLRRLISARQGASAVELALALPLLLLLLLLAIDYALAFSAQMRLSSAAARAAELATGSGRVLSSYEFLAAEAQTAAPGATATVTNWLECNAVRQQDAAGVCGSGIRFSRYVQVRVADTYQPIFRLGSVVGAPIPIEGAATVRVQ